MGSRVKKATMRREGSENSLVRDLFHRWCEQRYENRKTLEKWLTRDHLRQHWIRMENLEKLPPF